MPPLKGSSKFHKYCNALPEPSDMLDRFVNVTAPSGKQTEAGNVKPETGFGKTANGMAEPATEGVSHWLKRVLPSLPTCRII